MWTTLPSPKLATTSESSSGEKRFLNTSSTAARSMVSTILPSRPSSIDSISILPAVELISASRSLTRGTTWRSPRWRARRVALATSVSVLVTVMRTETPERWLTWLLARATWLNVATISDMNSGSVTMMPPPSPSNSARSSGRASAAAMSISVSTSSG